MPWQKDSEKTKQNNKHIMIQINKLSKEYNSEVVLNISDLLIKQNESVGLVGNNGAGKTTLFRLILDLIKANSGSVTSNSVDVRKNNNWKYYTGSYLDQNFLIDFLTPVEYFEFLGEVHNLSRGDITNFYDENEEFFAGEILGKNKYIRDLSQGNRQKVGIAAALMFKPELVILDEPFNGLDPSTQIRLINRINKLKQENGVTFLISSHDLSHVTEVSDRIVVLKEGSVIYDLEKNDNTLKELEKFFATH